MKFLFTVFCSASYSSKKVSSFLFDNLHNRHNMKALKNTGFMGGKRGGFGGFFYCLFGQMSCIG